METQHVELRVTTLGGAGTWLEKRVHLYVCGHLPVTIIIGASNLLISQSLELDSWPFLGGEDIFDRLSCVQGRCPIQSRQSYNRQSTSAPSQGLL